VEQSQATLKRELFRVSRTLSKSLQLMFMEKDRYLPHSQLHQQQFPISLLALLLLALLLPRLHSVGQNHMMEVPRLQSTISTGIKDLERHSSLLHHQHQSTIRLKPIWRLRQFKQEYFTPSQFPRWTVLAKDHSLCRLMLTSLRKFLHSLSFYLKFRPTLLK